MSIKKQTTLFRMAILSPLLVILFVLNCAVSETPADSTVDSGNNTVGLSDADNVSSNSAALAIIYQGTDSAASVTTNITLPVSGSAGSTITWSSTNTSVIATNGVVTPVLCAGNASITLAAAISKGSSSNEISPSTAVAHQSIFHEAT